ncbi:MAG: recombinase family protein, partial [Oscillospiraceae bacterium]|nr:recombinase family protein [Oscillospiraceae bacterium]
TMKNGKAVEVSEEIYKYLVKSDRRIRYIEEDLKRNTYIVRRIFKEYLDGRGVYEISAILNLECVERPPNAKEWYPQFISNIIANERYIGDSLLQKKYMTDTLPFQKKSTVEKRNSITSLIRTGP